MCKKVLSSFVLFHNQKNGATHSGLHRIGINLKHSYLVLTFSKRLRLVGLFIKLSLDELYDFNNRNYHNCDYQ